MKGLLALQHIMIVRGRMETIWASLRAFGYRDDLSLVDELVSLPTKLFPVKPGDAVEVSPHGKTFLVSQFVNCSSRTSRASSPATPSWLPSDAQKYFEVIPGSLTFFSNHLGFPNCLPVSIEPDDGSIDMTAWDAFWTLLTLVDPRRTYSTLNMLGYEPPQGQSRTDTLLQRTSNSDLASKERSAFMCFVIGAPSVGKSTLLRSFVGRSNLNQADLVFAINRVQEHWLALHNAGSSDKLSAQSTISLDQADCAAVCFDIADGASLQSAVEAVERLKQTDSQLPVILVGLYVIEAIHTSGRPLLTAAFYRKADSPSALKTPTAAAARKFARAKGFPLHFCSAMKGNLSPLLVDLLKAAKNRRCEYALAAVVNHIDLRF